MNFFEKGLFRNFRKMKSDDLQKMIFRMKLTYSEIEGNLDINNIVSYSQIIEQVPDIYETVDISTTLPSFITVTINDTRPRTILKFQPSSAALGFSKRKILCIQFWGLQTRNFTQVLLLVTNHFTWVHICITWVFPDKFFISIAQPDLYSFTLEKPTGCKRLEQPRIKHLNKFRCNFHE